MLQWQGKSHSAKHLSKLHVEMTCAPISFLTCRLHCFKMKCPQAFQSLDFRFVNFGNNVTTGIEASACFPLSPMNRRRSFTLIPAYNEEVMCLHVSVLISQHSLQLKPLKASVSESATIPLQITDFIHAVNWTAQIRFHNLT